MQQPYRTRLEIVFAASAPKAVILRRGPRRHYHLIAWDLKSNTFTHGQWMKGAVRLCDLSPSGDKLLYWAAQYHASQPEHKRVGRLREEGEEPVAYEPISPTRADVEAFKKRHPKRRLPRLREHAPHAHVALHRLPEGDQLLTPAGSALPAPVVALPQQAQAASAAKPTATDGPGGPKPAA